MVFRLNLKVSEWMYFLGFMDLLAVSIIIPALPSYMKKLDASPSIIGAIGSIYGAVQFFSSPIVGRISDVHDRRKILVLLICLSAFGYFMSIFFTRSLVILTILRIIPGLFKHSQDLGRACLLEEEGEHDRTKLLGNYNAFSGAGFIIGPTLHGFLMQRYGSDVGIKISFGLCSFLFCVNALIVLAVVIPMHNKNQREHKIQNSNGNLNDCTEKSSEKDKDMKTTSHWGVHQVIFFSRFLLAFSVMIFRSTFVLWLLHYFPSFTPQLLGYILSYNGFVGFVFGFLVGQISTLSIYAKQEEKLQLHASFLIVGALFLLAIVSNIKMIIIAMTLLTLGTANARVCGIALTMKYSKRNEMGTIQGVGASILSVARFASPFISGLLMEVGFWLPNVVATVTAFMGLLVYYFYLYVKVEKVKTKAE